MNLHELDGTATVVPIAKSKAGATPIALVVAIAAFMQMLDSSIIGTALPYMGAAFRVSAVDVGVGIIVYVLAASIVIPASAWIADRFGARRVFIAAIAIFTVTSVMSGLSSGLGVFVVARALQGAGGALMSAVGQIILVRSVARTALLRVINISSAPMLVAPVLGPPLGGLITATLGWQWIFYINVPIGAFGMLAGAHFLAPSLIVRRSFDWAGFILNATSLSLVLFGVDFLTSSFVSPLAATGAIMAGLVIGGFAIRHLRRHPHPLLSLEPLRFTTFRISAATALPLIRLPIGALTFALPILLQVGFGISAPTSGLVLLAHATGDLTMKLFMTSVFTRFSYRSILVLMTALTAIGISGCGLFTVHTPITVMLIVLLLCGCTRSFVMTGLNTLAYAEIPKPLSPSAVTLNQIVLQIAAALSVSLASLCFSLSIRHRGGIPGYVTPIDGRLTLFVLGAIGLFAVPILLRLPRHAGKELHTHALATEEE